MITMEELMRYTPAELRGVMLACEELLREAREQPPCHPNQTRLAMSLAIELATCGHDVSGVDLLDALASCGMELIQPLEPSTSTAYIDEIRRALGDGP